MVEPVESLNATRVQVTTMNTSQPVIRTVWIGLIVVSWLLVSSVWKLKALFTLLGTFIRAGFINLESGESLQPSER